MDIVFKGRVKNGKIELEDKLRFYQHKKRLEDKRVDLILRKRKTPRSLEQNSYYWGVVVKILAEEFGYANPEEVHEALKFGFLRKSSKPLDTCKSTTELSTREMEIYLSKIRRWARVEYNIEIPKPSQIEI